MAPSSFGKEIAMAIFALTIKTEISNEESYPLHPAASCDISFMQPGKGRL
jgi:hypothetical protein